MDSLSVVKYQKFEPNTELEETPKKSKLTRVLLVIVVILLCATLLVAVVLAIGIGVGTTQQQRNDGLQNVVVTNNQLQGEYYGDQGGIRFESIINETHIYFKVSTIGGELVVVIIRPVDTPMMMFEMNQTAFLTMENEQGPDAEYVIPEAYTNEMESIMMGFDTMTNEMLDKMDNKSVSEKSHDSIKSLAMSSHATLIVEAALALGETGLTGTDSQAAMKFYTIALKLLNAKDSVDPAQTVPSYSSGSERQRRSHLTRCSSNGAICPSERCPFKEGSNNCLGLCGRGCSCWSFVCGDCCINEYCLTHDRCCANAGFFTFTCFSVAVKKPFSSCDDEYEC